MRITTRTLVSLAVSFPLFASAAVIDCVEAESATGPAKQGGEYRVAVRPVVGARHDLVLSQEYEGGSIVFFESEMAKVEAREGRVVVSGGDLKVEIDLAEAGGEKLRGRFAFDSSDEATPLLCDYLE